MRRPWLSTFASAAAVATGLARVARLNGEATRVVCWAGDGGTYDIGMATLSAAAERERGHALRLLRQRDLRQHRRPAIVGHAGRAPATTTTPGGKLEPKKDILGIMAAHRIPYAASISLAHAEDGLRKMRRAVDLSGFRFLHVLCPCPTGWKSEPALGIELVRLAVRSGLYPILEIFDGRALRINVEPDFSDEALELYLSLQRRFQRSGLTAADLRPAIDRNWRELRARSGRIVPAERAR